MNYYNQFVRFERNGDKVTPVRVRKEWVETPRGRKFCTVRLTEVGFGRPNHGQEEWSSCPATPEPTREALDIREAGYGEPCLPMGTPAEWSNAVANSPSPWEPYGFGTEVV